jgi:hypothetical protein
MIRDRLNDLKTLNVPGPGKYAIDRSPRSHAAAFHTQRRELDGPDSPGPKYDIAERTGSAIPSYSFRSRIDVKKELLKPPYQRLPESFGHETPRYSLSSRHKDIDWGYSPGPKYIPPDFGTDGQKCTAHPDRGRDIGQGPIPIGPGGGKYDTRPDMGGRHWTMKARHFGPDLDFPDGPGSGKFLPDFAKILPADGKGRQGLERFKEELPVKGAQYRDLGSTNYSPKWTIQPKEIPIVPGSIF